jgi:hypothetical protein
MAGAEEDLRSAGLTGAKLYEAVLRELCSRRAGTAAAAQAWRRQLLIRSLPMPAPIWLKALANELASVAM